METIRVRRAKPRDLAGVAAMAHSLWPDGAVSEHAAQFAAYIAGDGPGELPDAIFVAEDPAGSLVGFAHAGLRSHADGCDPSHPVGYLEGWYVAPSHRRMRVGAQLVAAAEGWARSLGCREMASDTWIDSFDSQQAHQALGYEVVDRCVHYRKNL